MGSSPPALPPSSPPSFLPSSSLPFQESIVEKLAGSGRHGRRCAGMVVIETEERSYTAETDRREERQRRRDKNDT